MAAPHPPRREPRRGIVTLFVAESSAIANAMAELFVAVVFCLFAYTKKHELLTVASPFIDVHAHTINGASCGDRYCDRQSKAILSASELTVFFVIQQTYVL